MKGFVHLIEIIIVSLVVFVVLFQLSSIERKTTIWAPLKNQLFASDALFALDTIGTDWFNKSQVDQRLDAVLASSNTVYRLSVKNAIKPNITVGCICSFGEHWFMNLILASSNQPVSVNSRSIAITLIRIPETDPEFSFAYDAIIVGKDVDLSSSGQEIRNYLGAGRGVIEYRQFKQAQIDPEVQTGIFGLQWDAALLPNGNPVFFTPDASETGSPFHDIYRYFYGVPPFADNFSVSRGWSARPAGSWTRNANKEYEGNDPGLALTISPAVSPSAVVSVNKTILVRTKILADGIEDRSFVLFSYRADDDFYYASADAKYGFWEIGHYDGQTFTPASPTSQFGEQIDIGTFYDLKITVQNGTVTLFADGSEKVGHAFTSLPLGDAGLAVNNSHAVFDDFRLQYLPEHAFNNEIGVQRIGPAGTARAILNQSGSRVPMAIANSGQVNTVGRTIWISSLPGVLSDDTTHLLRSAVLWAAGNEFDVIPLQIANPVTATLFKTYNGDLFEIVEIALAVGSPF